MSTIYQIVNAWSTRPPRSADDDPRGHAQLGLPAALPATAALVLFSCEQHLRVRDQVRLLGARLGAEGMLHKFSLGLPTHSTSPLVPRRPPLKALVDDDCANKAVAELTRD